jgi:CheY-like chemotaxis protein
MERFTTRKTQEGTGCVFMMNEPAFEGEVLLCEDNEMNQALICKRLTKAGLKIVAVDNGKEGVEAVISRIQNGTKPFDLIFMDIFMPVMGGTDAAEEINKLNTGTPIIALTASSDPGEREQYLEHGMSDCVGKPFTSQEMLSCLVKYLKPRAFGPVDLDTAGHSVVYKISANDHSADNVQAKQYVSPISDKKFKIKLINMFLKSNKNIYHEINKAADEGDMTLAHRLTHTLKGNAGMLGKTRLQKAADDVEHHFIGKTGSGIQFELFQTEMNVLKTELDAVVKEFELFLANAAMTANVEIKTKKQETLPLSIKESLALLDELDIMLEGGNTECLNLIDTIRLIPENSGPLVNGLLVNGPLVNGPLVNGPLVRELIHQIDYFDFDLAKETIAKLKEKLTEPGNE